MIPRPPHPRLKPCRQYFYIDSEHHLIDNGLIASARDTFNAVEVAYIDESTKAYPPSFGAPDPSAFFTAHTMPVKCSESLREDYCRWFTTRERNCEGSVWAQRYGMAHLFHALKDLYQGKIVITGEPAMKPYDQCSMYDSYNDMHGVFEVEQVTHIFSSETGFVTCIVPDLVVECIELASMALTDALEGEGDLSPKQPGKSACTPIRPHCRGVFPGPKARGYCLSGLITPVFRRQIKEWPLFSSPSA